jgi:hypothetical protein
MTLKDYQNLEKGAVLICIKDLKSILTKGCIYRTFIAYGSLCVTRDDFSCVAVGGWITDYDRVFNYLDIIKPEVVDNDNTERSTKSKRR